MKKLLAFLRGHPWPASVAPALLGSVVAARNGFFSWPGLGLALPALLMINYSARLACAYRDLRNGAAPQSATRPVLLKALGLLCAGTAIGLLLAYKNGLPALLWLGAAGILLAWFRIFGPGDQNRALGDMGIFLSFGPLIVTGTAIIHSRQFLPEALWASIPAGLLAAGIRHADSMSGSIPGQAAGVRSFAVILGPRNALRLYYLLAFSPYLFTLTFGSVWPPVFCALSVPLAVRLDRLARRGAYSELARETSMFHAAWIILLCAGLYVTY